LGGAQNKKIISERGRDKGEFEKEQRMGSLLSRIVRYDARFQKKFWNG
jgi:hypothetical protein